MITKRLTLLILGVLTICSCYEQNKPIQEKVETEITEKHQEFHPNGKIKIKGDVVKNLKQGKWESFYENGAKWSESNYLFGRRNGLYKTFYPNGKLKIHGSYENDQKSGIWFFYTEEGKFEKEIDFNTNNSDANNSI